MFAQRYVNMNHQRDNAACLDALQAFVDQSLSRHVLDGLMSMKTQADEIREQNSAEQVDHNTVMMQLLKEVRQWTQTLLDEEVRRIESLVPFLSKLLTALFIMKVKVLSCLNMRQNNEDFPLTVPSNHTFIHQIYIHAAQSLMDNIDLTANMNMSNMRELLTDAVRKAEYQCLQWGDLLDWGLGNMDTGKLLSMIDEQPAPANDLSDNNFAAATEPDTSVDRDDEPQNDDTLDSIANDAKVTESAEDGEDAEPTDELNAEPDTDAAAEKESHTDESEGEETRTVGEKDERPTASFW